MKKLTIVSILVASLLGVGVYVGGRAAAQADHKPGMMGHTKDMKGMEEMEKDVQSRHQAMMARMDSLNDQLQEKVAVMQKASGDEKVEAMQAVIEELVDQRKTMQHQMMGMMPQMMRHMMQHMSTMKGMEGMGEMMKTCPMMQGMQGMHGE